LEIANSKQQRKLRHIFVHLELKYKQVLLKQVLLESLKEENQDPVALRADIDALPVKKELIFLVSKSEGEYNQKSKHYARLWS
jgi:metal-dependent amidase/aminoacylase/carboxypeptidase family protein